MKHRQRSEQVDVLIVCSPGGHLLEMLALESVWSTNARAWVTLPGEDARWILRGETVYFAHAPTIRSVTNLIRNLLLAVALLRRLRPTLAPGRYSVRVCGMRWTGRSALLELQADRARHRHGIRAIGGARLEGST